MIKATIKDESHSYKDIVLSYRPVSGRTSEHLPYFCTFSLIIIIIIIIIITIIIIIIIILNNSTILFRTQEECTIIIIIIVRMEAFYSSTCISILLVFEFLISSFNVCIFTDYVK